jgi:DNA-binding NarL/FixJ family response regulator
VARGPGVSLHRQSVVLLDPLNIRGAHHSLNREKTSGEAAMPRALVTRLMDEFRARGSRRVAIPGGHPVQLTAREWQVLEGMREGLSTAALADRLHVAPVTVRTHVAAILRKLRVTDRDAAVRLLDGA